MNIGPLFTLDRLRLTIAGVLAPWGQWRKPYVNGAYCCQIWKTETLVNYYNSLPARISCSGHS